MTEEKKTFICLKDAIRVVYRTKHMVDLTDSMKSVVIAKDAIVLGLEKLPTIEEPKTGHWIDDTRLGYHVSICSNCNWRGHGGTSLIYKPNYCPNCGAKMESEE